ncbi:alpha/beta hydrolase family protein [Streptomyces hirsutus]|uniref:hypothetical protein n=1 Tax=Streptomyces hirsutus TaxID=35620 RepID=UPI0036A539B0
MNVQPGTWIARVSPTPLLMVVATGDTATVTDLALAAYEKALRLKRLELILGCHFDPCIAQFDTSSRAAVAWFRDHLTKAPDAGMPHLTYTLPPAR